MKCIINREENTSGSLNRAQRKAMHKRLKPTIKRIVELEKQIKAGVNKEAAENEISAIMEKLTMVEMFAIEDYIYNKDLLDNKK